MLQNHQVLHDYDTKSKEIFPMVLLNEDMAPIWLISRNSILQYCIPVPPLALVRATTTVYIGDSLHKRPFDNSICFL